METLDQIQERMEEIESSWNGKNPGAEEDRAHLARQAILLTKTLREVLDEL